MHLLDHRTAHRRGHRAVADVLPGVEIRREAIRLMVETVNALSNAHASAVVIETSSRTT